jgi:energy-coupling factor transport system ATP-binding protein
MPEAILCADGLSFWYPGTREPALRDVALRVHEGDFVGIVGPTGAGKTTLLHALGGVIPWYEKGTRHGSVTLLGRDVSMYDGLPELTRHINLMLQDPEAQLFNLHVVEELAWGLENFGVPVPEMRRRIDEAASLFGVEPLLARTTYGLSGGEKQRVTLAAVYALRPRIVLLDEPTSELDPVGTEMVFAAVRTLATHGVTVVMVEHKIELLVEHANRLVLMGGGRVLRDAEVRTFFAIGDLRASGLYPPQVYDLGRALEESGVSIGRAPLTLAEGVEVGRRVLATGAARR